MARPAPIARAPGRGWYVLAAIIAVAGWAGMVMFLVARLGGSTDRMMRVVVPGEAELRLNEPGTYTIFHEYRSTVDGRVYDVPNASGLDVTVRARRSGVPLELKRGADSSYQVGGSAGRSLFDFEVREPGAYQVVGVYADRRREPQTVLAIDRGFVGDLIITILVGFAAAFGGTGLAVGIVIFVATRRRNVKDLGTAGNAGRA